MGNRLPRLPRARVPAAVPEPEHGRCLRADARGLARAHLGDGAGRAHGLCGCDPGLGAARGCAGIVAAPFAHALPIDRGRAFDPDRRHRADHRGDARRVGPAARGHHLPHHFLPDRGHHHDRADGGAGRVDRAVALAARGAHARVPAHPLALRASLYLQRAAHRHHLGRGRRGGRRVRGGRARARLFHPVLDLVLQDQPGLRRAPDPGDDQPDLLPDDRHRAAGVCALVTAEAAAVR